MTRRGSATGRTKRQRRKARDTRDTAAERELERESKQVYSSVEQAAEGPSDLLMMPDEQVVVEIIHGIRNDPPCQIG